MRRIISFTFVFLFMSSVIRAQIGDHRNELAIGFNGGYVMSNVGFTPSVTQKMHGGLTGGLLSAIHVKSILRASVPLLVR